MGALLGQATSQQDTLGSVPSQIFDPAEEPKRGHDRNRRRRQSRTRARTYRRRYGNPNRNTVKKSSKKNTHRVNTSTLPPPPSGEGPPPEATPKLTTETNNSSESATGKTITDQAKQAISSLDPSVYYIAGGGLALLVLLSMLNK